MERVSADRLLRRARKKTAQRNRRKRVRKERAEKDHTEARTTEVPMGKKIVCSVFLLGLLFFGVLPAGLLPASAASRKKKKVDITKLKAVRIADKKPRLQFVLPRGKSRRYKSLPTVKWRFLSTEEAKKRDQAFWKSELEKCEKYLKDADKLKIPPEKRKRLENLAGICRAQIQRLEQFYAGVRLVVEDSETPDTCVVIKTTEINRTYTLEDAINEAKRKPPPWLLYLVKVPGEVLDDKPVTRFKKWRGRRLHIRYQGTYAAKGEEPKVFHELVFLYRRIYKKGDVYLVEVHCRWTDALKKRKSYAAVFDYLLRGFALIDR